MVINNRQGYIYGDINVHMLQISLLMKATSQEIYFYISKFIWFFIKPYKLYKLQVTKFGSYSGKVIMIIVVEGKKEVRGTKRVITKED